ncbi:HlyD family efflux transporter periplasmic adaptor subunit [Sphingomonas sp. CGMCC 1.13654]|uniref:HlyD family efflux transporter periplasmic adaptor subunit n=1 Tax=Sphingomonas chungangi TaxID=2683589 RepID=A0A838L9X2_9SPHN|nr:HlyD family efflux transporter periplasmic adaptor subunit [Sphingomonas chungangi]MBA2934308.1 HlyD family efflux transporter periplasmic adaptor subunit [Sphingomonas chungangi]MVW57349.1 HlyD family efflux transporter periplasmic adaptor subunit [Sphingomonas chungangi]
MAEADPMIETHAPETKPGNPKRRRALLGIGGAVLLAGVGYGGWYALVGSHHVSTDNAYVGADTAQVTPMVAGQVAQVLVSDAQTVKRGDVLVRIDDSDARIALADAEAALAKAKRQFGQTSATGSSLASTLAAKDQAIAGAQAQLSSAQAALQKAAIDLDRRRKLAPSGAVSADELTSAINSYAAAKGSADNARAALQQAISAKDAAKGDLAANQALIDGTTVVTNPDVLAAQAKVDQARLDLSRTVIRAPVDGVVTNRNVQVGQRLAQGAAIMKVVPIRQLYVDANFKEGQLAHVAPGQKVEITSDLYGAGVVYHGTVVGFSGGTGSAFALIPAQNATGNWIKIVQRLPVRIRLDPRELDAHPLRVGLSMDADIHI